MNAPHTPRLLFSDYNIEAVPHYNDNGKILCFNCDVYELGGPVSFRTSGQTAQEAESAAWKIINAVKSRAELIAALESFIACELTGDAALYIDQARAAIAKAKGVQS